MKESLIIVDCFGFVFRAYHIHQELTINGKSVGALYGFTSMMLKMLNDFNPNQIAVVLDSGNKNFRHDLFPDYKANRPDAPEDLKSQIILIKEMLEVFNLPVVKHEEFEADDLIASLATLYAKQNKQVIIISSDKDMFQLMGGLIKIYDPIKAKFISEEDVVKKFGVKSSQMKAFQALVGDKSDNIPGVRGVGIKTAAKLIEKFGNIENLLNSLHSLENVKQKNLIENSKEDLLISIKLVELKKDIILDNKDYFWKINHQQDIINFLQQYHFKSLYKRAASLFDFDVNEFISNKLNKNFQLSNLDNMDDLIQMVEDAKKEGFLSLHCDNVSQSLYIFIEKLDKENSICKIELNNTELDFGILWDLLISEEVKKITLNLKNLLHSLPCKVDFCEDIIIMDYVLNTGKKKRNISQIIIECDFEHQEFQEEFQYLSCYKQIYQTLQTKLVQKNSAFLYYIEINTLYVLYDMEINGILLDKHYLDQMSQNLLIQISELENKIFKIVGEKFNILSTKQLADILFNKMKLPYGKISSKTHNFSTNVEILEKLSFENYEIANLVLKYRHLSKLNSTYASALPKYADLKDQRIHSHFIQNQTSTGRITSSEPNLQNIPIKTSEGALIRRAFIAPKGSEIFSSDYSQIELKILAAIADVKLLKKAFDNNVDIHTSTASEIFSIAQSEVTKDLRYKAKTINFSIIYGIKAFTLAQRLHISNQEAEEYIVKYFSKYPEIRVYIEKTIDFAKRNKYVQNFFGRRIHIPEINSTNFQLREFSKRAAINAPIQSCAAEIIKIAMVTIFKDIKQQGLKSKFLIQIHDELVFEVTNDESAKMSSLIVDNMKKSFILNVPIEVSLKRGANFLDLY